MSIQTPSAAPQPAERPAAQSPLTLVMPVKSPQAAAQLRALLTTIAAQPDNPIVAGLDTVRSVHFARFVLLENDTRFAVITSYDGDLETYVMEFIDVMGDIFDALLAFVGDLPPGFTSVRAQRDAFVDYVRSHDVPIVGSFYSAYPSLRVNDILAGAGPAAG